MYKEAKVGHATFYVNALIADGWNFYFLSMFGRPSLIKAVSAAIAQGRYVEIGELEVSKPSFSGIKILTQSLDGICHKVIYVPEYFQNTGRSRIVLGEDLDTAFDFVENITSTPLKREWKQWLWDEVLEKEKLTCFGSIGDIELNQAYLVRLCDTNLDDLVLEGIRSGKLN